MQRKRRDEKQIEIFDHAIFFFKQLAGRRKNLSHICPILDLK